MLGIFGGTFDPVHFGHLRPALEVKQALALDELRFIPCNIPPHRGAPVASVSQRLSMLQLALEGVPGCVIDQRELQRTGPSYMVDTLASLRAEQDSRPICLILGMDAFLGLDRWHQWQRLLALAHIVVATRPGSRLPEHGEVVTLANRCRSQDPQALKKAASGLIYFQDVTQMDISATTIREAVRAKRDVHFLLPETVRLYIEREGIYRG